jgi:hypothetical protein
MARSGVLCVRVCVPRPANRLPLQKVEPEASVLPHCCGKLVCLQLRPALHAHTRTRWVPAPRGGCMPRPPATVVAVSPCSSWACFAVCGCVSCWCGWCICRARRACAIACRCMLALPASPARRMRRTATGARVWGCCLGTPHGVETSPASGGLHPRQAPSSRSKQITCVCVCVCVGGWVCARAGCCTGSKSTGGCCVCVRCALCVVRRAGESRQCVCVCVCVCALECAMPSVPTWCRAGACLRARVHTCVLHSGLASTWRVAACDISVSSLLHNCPQAMRSQ